MKEEKERLINYRAFGLSAIVMLGTIFCVFNCFDSLWYILPLVVMTVSLVIYFIINRSYFNFIFVAICIILAVVGVLTCIYAYNDKSYDNKLCNIECRVDSINSIYGDTSVVFASEVTFDGDFINGKIKVTIYGSDSIKMGDKLSFSGKVKVYDVVDLVKNNHSLYRERVKYSVNINNEKLSLEEGSLTLSEKLKEKTKTNILDIMGERIGGVAYALLYGDKALIDAGIYSSFRDSGTAHLLAISGLHISLIIGLLYFIVSRLKVHKGIKFCIMAVFLLVYCYLCNFAVSVVRASIMGLVLIGCKLFGRRYDSLNSLGFALSLILLFSPLALFDVGLLLSFVAVLSIILFSKVLDKVKFPNNIVRKVLTTMFITLCVTIMTYPITASYFKTLPIYSLFTNLIAIPLFSVAFILLFVCNIFSLIGLKVLLVVPKLALELVITITEFFASLPGAVIKVGGISIGVALLAYLVAFIISRFVMIKNKTKVVSCFAIFCVCGSIVVGNNYITNNLCRVYFDTEVYDCVVTSGGYNYLVGPKISRSNNYKISQSLKSCGIVSLDGIVFAPSDNVEVTLLRNFLEDYSGATIYVPYGHSMIDNLIFSNLNYVTYNEGSILKGNMYIKVMPLDSYNYTSMVINGVNIVIGAEKVPQETFDKLDLIIDYLCYDSIFEAERVGKVIDRKTIINCR